MLHKPTVKMSKLKRKRLGKLKFPKVQDAEADIQGMAEQLCAIHGIPFLRLPDALLRTVFANPSTPLHIKKICSEYLKGIPDLILFNKNSQKYLGIEIKTERGRLSHAQKRWQRMIGTKVTHGWETTKQAIDEFNERR